MAGEVGRAHHGLRNAVEARPLAIGAAMAEGGNGGEDDVGLHRLQAVIVEPHGLQRRRRQVGDHDIGGGDELLHDFPAFLAHRVECEAALVPVHLQIHGAFAAIARCRSRHNRLHEPVFAAVALFHPDDFRTEIAQQRRAIGAGDVAPEIEHPDAFEKRRYRAVLIHC